jgi:hypothetical protein
MSYYSSLAILLVVLISATVIGWRFTDLLPWRLRPESRIFLAPGLGLAVLIHLVVLLGWISRGYHQRICLLLMAILLITALWGRRDLTKQIQNAFLISLFALVTTIGVLCPVWRFAVINPYNDTFTYWVHGQWLQTHSFRVPAMQSGSYPALTQVLCYQLIGLRMGASFMLGFVQAMMGADWSYRVYPAVVSIPVVACGLAIAGTAYAVCRKISLSLLCGAAIGLTLNGVSYGASNGFLPQTWGLAFVAGGLVLAGQIPRHCVRCPTKKALGYWIPVAVLLSAAILCYSEVTPFIVGTMGIFLLVVAILLRRYFARVVLTAVWLSVLCVALVNLEWFRIARAIRSQASSIVGMAVNWPWWHFLSVAMGLCTGTHDVKMYLLGKSLLEVSCVVGAGFILAGLWWSRRSRGRLLELMPHLAFLSLAAVAFAYFRYAAPSPWPIGTGQSWNQFKLSNWATPSMFCLLAVGIAALARNSPIRSAVLSIGLIGILVAGSVCHWQLAENRTRSIREDAGLSFDPLSAFFQMRQFSRDIPTNDLIYLNTSKVGARQMLMYALMDRPVAGNWDGDVWVKYWLPPDQLQQPIEQTRWMVSMDPWVPADAHSDGNLWLGSSPRTAFILQSSAGGYPRETDRTGWWQWTDRQLHFTYRIQGEQPRQVIASFTSIAVSDHRPVHLRIGGKTVELFLDGANPGWKSAPIEIDRTNRTVDVVFDCDLPPVKLSDQDPRLASYLIKNLALHRADQGSTGVPLQMLMTSGWYPTEHSGQDWLCWTESRGRLSVSVSNDTAAILSGQILSAQRPNDVDILVNGAKVASVRIDWTKWEFRNFPMVELSLKAGGNAVEFVSHNPAITIATDPRALAIAVKNLRLTASGN